MHTFELTVDEISKIEGKCGVTVKVVDDQVTNVQFAITEYKRFYTKALTGKDVIALPQLACRICGTCSNAHLLCAIQAAEKALDITPSEQTLALRKLLNYGLNIRDHALHLYVFVLPDLFNIDNILELDENNAEQHQILHDTFEVKAVGNALSLAIGGRSVHAPYPVIGGFTKLPKNEDFPALLEKLYAARPAVLRLIRRFASCEWKLTIPVQFAAITNNDYSFIDGEIHDSCGETIPAEALKETLSKVDIPYSHATGYKFREGLYMVGALARMNLGKASLNAETQKDCEKELERFPSKNLYDNNLAQAIEILHAIDASIALLKSLTIVPEKPQPVVRKKGTGIGVLEAPRGALFYQISIDEKGSMHDISIIVPTGQNQIGIEAALKEHFQNNLEKTKEELAHDAEVIVRAYDPCMSCASHFLKIKWE